MSFYGGGQKDDAPYTRMAELINRDSQLKDLSPIATVSKEISQPGLKTIEIICKLLNAYADRPALAQRKHDIVRNPQTGQNSLRYLPQYVTISYREVQSRVQSLANLWKQDSAHSIRPFEFVCILGFASTDYVIIDLACIFAGAVSVPLQTNLSADGLAAIIKEVTPRCLFVSLENLDKALAVIETGGAVSNLVIMDYEPEDDAQNQKYQAARQKLQAKKTTVLILTDLLTQGALLPAAAPYIPMAGENPISTLLYTSGSSGTPKGAIFTDRLSSKWWAEGGGDMPMVTLVYQPLNHGTGRSGIMKTMNRGGTCFFIAKSDMTTIFEDARLARPTWFVFVPRIAELVYDHFRSEVKRNAQAGVDHKTACLTIMREMKTSFLGGRLVAGVIATAPTAPEIAAFIAECFGIALADVYGCTEAGPISSDGVIQRPPVIDYKLLDVPELGYLTSDKPYPRGQLILNTSTAIDGYFKNPEQTAKLFDSEGYLITDDIVEQRGPDQIFYIDRKNNVLKLAQGEFVAVAHLEALFASGHPMIHQIYQYGNSTRSYLLAVVVPDPDAARLHLGYDPSDIELRKILRDAIKTVAQSESLRAYEVPRDFIIAHEGFSVENGLLTDIGKCRRPMLKLHYEQQMEALYVEIENRQRQELETLRNGDPTLDILNRVKRALEATLGVVDLDLSRHQSFSELGGDSLAAVSLSVLLEEVFGTTVPVGQILDSTASPRDLASYIEAKLRNSDTGQVTFDQVHGKKNPTEIPAADFALDKMIGAKTLDVPTKPRRREINTVLITGANGFLGRFICLEWLERLAPLGGKVICLIRAQDEAMAKQRLYGAFDKGDQKLLQRFTALAADHLEVLVGDLSAARLDLDQASYDRLSENVDLIVHVAALVNHKLGYQQLFEPNVLGTAELIKLALAGCGKQFDYVSSIAVAHLLKHKAIGEDEDIRIACAVCAMDGSYASGYATSKWAGEVMLREAHERFNLPVNIFRSDMILPHRLYAGQINVPDVFTRLLYSILQTGMAPISFYPLETNGARVRSHYNGLPVDFIARTIVEIGASTNQEFSCFNIDNPHDDDISLDRFVDWIVDAGYPLTRTMAFPAWLQQFEEKLKLLPEKQRQQSSLAILEQLRSPDASPMPIDCKRFREKVRQLATDASGDIPQLSRHYIQKCIGDLITLGMIENKQLAFGTV